MRTLKPTVLLSIAVNLAALLASARPLAAQKGLAAKADTNDAYAVYQFGVEVMERNPKDASLAFQRAHRLNPDWAEPLYAQSIAVLLQSPHLLRDYMRGTRKSRDVIRSDSLYREALSLNPFVYRRYDRELIDRYFDDIIRGNAASSGNDAAFMRFQIDRILREDPSLRAWLAYADGRFEDAVKNYTGALETERYKINLQASRARSFFLAGDYKSALTDMTAALQALRQADAKDQPFFYNSKAMFEHSIAVLHEFTNNTEGAREAYARALQEDLSFYPAHLRLGTLLLAQGDTAGATSEYDLAVQIQAKDPLSRVKLATLLIATGQHADAVAHLKAGIAAEPAYAASYRLLGVAYEGLKDPAGARAQYEMFLARAARGDAAVPWARERIAALATTAAQ